MPVKLPGHEELCFSVRQSVEFIVVFSFSEGYYVYLFSWKSSLYVYQDLYTISIYSVLTILISTEYHMMSKKHIDIYSICGINMV